MRAIVILLAVAALGATPAAAAPPVSVPVPAEPDALAYAPGHVLWATHTLHGPIVVHQAPATGGPESVLATIPRVHPSSEEVLVTLAANAGGYAVAVRDARLIPTGECGCDYPVSQGELLVRGGYDGSTSTLVHCVPAARPRAAVRPRGRRRSPRVRREQPAVRRGLGRHDRRERGDRAGRRRDGGPDLLRRAVPGRGRNRGGRAPGHGRARVRHRDGRAARPARRAGLARRPQPDPAGRHAADQRRSQGDLRLAARRGGAAPAARRPGRDVRPGRRAAGCCSGRRASARAAPR